MATKIIYEAAYLLPLAIAFFLIIFPLLKRWKLYRKSRLFRVIKQSKAKPHRLVRFILNTKVGIKAVDRIAVQLSVLNGKSIENNLQLAGTVVMVMMGLFCASGVAIFFFNILWYVKLGYLLLLCFFVFMCGVLLTSVIKIQFLSQLPEVIKIINSRYMTERNILRAIDVSLKDFKPVPRKVMTEISNSMKRNDAEQLDIAFNHLKRVYDSEHLVMLLTLIKQAHYKGGIAMIQEQFEELTEDILVDIENSKDLVAASRMYVIFAAICTPVMLIIIERFSLSALGPDSMQYYHSPQGATLKIILIAATILYSFLMFFMEKQS